MHQYVPFLPLKGIKNRGFVTPQARNWFTKTEFVENFPLFLLWNLRLAPARQDGLALEEARGDPKHQRRQQG